jgi:hypothetical protein
VRSCRSDPSSVLSFFSVLQLFSGDTELNPGPVDFFTHANNRRVDRSQSEYINSGSLNGRSAAKEIALPHDIIIDKQLDILTLSQTWFTTNTPITILNEVAPSCCMSVHIQRLLVTGDLHEEIVRPSITGILLSSVVIV